MIAYVERISDEANQRQALRGPLLGCNLEFVSKHGMPVFFFSEDDALKLEAAVAEQAAPGMVGIGRWDGLLYTVLRDGTVSALPLQVINIVNEYPSQPVRRKEVEPTQ